MRISEESNGIKVDFRIGDPDLDLVALRIIWNKDKKLWRDFVKRFSVFATMGDWEDKVGRVLIWEVYDDKQQELLQAKQTFKEWWSESESRWFSFLAEVFESTGVSNITFFADIGIAPISPRDLNQERFLIPFYVSKAGVKRICAHETSHFFFYRKIKEIDFAVQPDEHHLWLISEVFVPLLFGDYRAVDILGQMPQDSYICKHSLIEKCRQVYQEGLERRINIQELLERLLRIEIKTEELNKEFLS
jgi:hypothetical protein